MFLSAIWPPFSFDGMDQEPSFAGESLPHVVFENSFEFFGSFEFTCFCTFQQWLDGDLDEFVKKVCFTSHISELQHIASSLNPMLF
jgi:hypothetical protein